MKFIIRSYVLFVNEDVFTACAERKKPAIVKPDANRRLVRQKVIRFQQIKIFSWFFLSGMEPRLCEVVTANAYSSSTIIVGNGERSASLTSEKPDGSNLVVPPVSSSQAGSRSLRCQ